MPDKPPIDLFLLDSTFGEEGRADLIETFLKHSQVLFQRINNAWEEKDIKTVIDVAHQMKGMGSSIYATDLSKQSLQLERLAKESSPDWQKMLVAFEEMKVLFTAVTDYLAVNHKNS